MLLEYRYLADRETRKIYLKVSLMFIFAESVLKKAFT